MIASGFEEVKLVELTIEMLRGTASEVFYLSNEYQLRGLDLLSYEEPITHAFSLNFCSKHITTATRNMLSDFAELGSALFLCRLYSVSEPTLRDYAYKDFDDNNCGLRSTISDLMVAVDEELCMMTTKEAAYCGHRRLKEDCTVRSHSIPSLLTLYLHCRHWSHLFKSIVNVVHMSFVQLRNGVSSRTATCDLLQHFYHLLHKSNLIEMPASELHSSSVSQWGSNRNTRNGRWKPHTNRWFDLFVCRTFESMLFKLLRGYLDANIEDETELVYPLFLETVSGAVISSVADLQSMHVNTQGGHSPRDLMNKRNSIIQALTEAKETLHQSQLRCTFPPDLLDASPLFLYLTAGSAIKKVGLTSTSTSNMHAVKNVTPMVVVPCVSADSRKPAKSSFTTKRWYTTTAVPTTTVSAAPKSDDPTTDALLGKSSDNEEMVPPRHDTHSQVTSDRPPLYTLGSFPIKFHAAYSTTLVQRLRTLDHTVAALVNSEHCVLHQLRYLRDLYFLGHGSHYFAGVRAICESLIFSVSEADTTKSFESNVDTSSGILALFHSVQGLMVEAKPTQEGILSVSLSGINPLVSEASNTGSRRPSEDNQMTEQILLSTVSLWRVELQLKFPLREIVPPNTVGRLNLLFQPLLQMQLVKWIFEFWWKAGVSSGLLSIIREQPTDAGDDAAYGLSSEQDVDVTVNRLKTNCTVGLNLVLRTVSTLLGHYISTAHFTFAEVFESRLDSQHCLVREYAALLEGLVTSVEEMMSISSRYIIELVTHALTASLHLRSALQLERQHVGMHRNEPSYFSVVLCYRRAEEAFSRCRGVVTQLKKRVEESEQRDLLFKL